MRTCIFFGFAFLFGCAVVAVPMLLNAQALYADETAGGEPVTKQSDRNATTAKTPASLS